jgi:hypothetical protein
MAVMTGLRWSTLLLTLYVGADLLNPTHPGAFSLERPQLFIDTAIERRQHASTTPSETQPEGPGRAEPSPKVSTPVSRTMLRRSSLLESVVRPPATIRRDVLYVPPAPSDDH